MAATLAEAIASALRESAEVHRRLALSDLGAVGRAADALTQAMRDGGKLLVFGNGGSAADAQHIAAEFLGRFKRDRPGMAALALTTDTSAVTSIANDLGFEGIFARQIEALAAPGDVVLAISTSGRSPNVLAGVRAAREAGALTIGLTGGDGGQLGGLADIAIVAPSRSTESIQECHVAIGHVLCAIVESSIVGVPLEADHKPLKVVGWDELVEQRERWRADGRTVVWTNGCFDLLHAGHARSLAAAKALGDVLVVGVNGDASVRALKGAGRPLVPVSDRMELVAALEPVDHVVVFEEETPVEALSRLRPDVHAKGADYAPPGGRPLPEAEVVRSYGGRIEFLPMLPGRSTSELVARVRTGHDD